MKLIKEAKQTKRVEYFGLPLTVPFWAKYLGTDKDGELYAYESEPAKDRESWYLFDMNLQMIGLVDLEGLNWSESLVEV